MTPRDATNRLALTVLSEADRHPHKQVGAWQTSVVLAREVVAQGETIAELRKMLGEACFLVSRAAACTTERGRSTVAGLERRADELLQLAEGEEP